VTLNQDSSAVAAEGVKAAGEIAKIKIETETTARTEAQKKEEESLQKRRGELKKLADSLAQAEIELAQAIAARDALPSDASSADKQAAAVAFAKAEAKVKELKAQLDSAHSDLGSFSTIVTPIKRPGPVLFTIKEVNCDLKKEDPKCEPLLQLVPLNFDSESQRTFEIYQAPDSSKTPAEKESKAPEKIEFENASLGEVHAGSSPEKVEVKTKTELLSLKTAQMKGSYGKLNPQQLPIVKKTTNKQIFELQFKPHTPPDEYTIEFIGVVKESLPEINGRLTVNVIP
jgi:hypothetical protein